MIETTTLDVPVVPGRDTGGVEEYWPPTPNGIKETGLPIEFLVTHLLKTLFMSGPATPRELAKIVHSGYGLTEELMTTLKSDQSIEAMDARGLSDWGIRYRLTAKGTNLAEAALERSRYAGAIPVTLTEYSGMVVRQSLRRNPPSQETLEASLGAFVLSEEVKENLALTFHSGRATLLFGATGNGKTSIVASCANTFATEVLFPYALYVAGQVIPIYDPVKHVRLSSDQPVPDGAGSPDPPRSGRSSPELDRRWVKIRRPVVFVGGELEPSDLDLSFDTKTRQYQAPAHMKAQDGIFVIDDFGRQRASPQDILNRWIVPMEKRMDNLALQTGESFTVPFEMALIFTSNLRLSDIADEAFLRRIPYKIHLPAPDQTLFAEITRVWCRRLQVDCTETGVEYFCQKVFGDPRVVPSAAQPRDIAQVIVDYARFKGVQPMLAPQYIDRACAIYFAREPEARPSST